MTIFLKNSNNQTIVDIEIWIETDVEISVSIDIEQYSKFLLKHNKDEQTKIIILFDGINQLRSWLWEQHFMTEMNVGTDKQYKEVVKELKDFLEPISEHYDLILVED